ncbi:hypothetical protein FE661_03760 [Acidithiobacillus ferrooxidans]|uniref:Restriction endonuclease type IV Mrr domain-containing protein n=2 Tax=Acidithiobacillus TaxID=119977 RepID=A0A2W1K6C3_ACIFR|nr:hypothetical protein DN052_04780 [Acidithiobacillus ferrooxidans]QLK41382.1 hypothetical protein FE661_03760 [Acidithiobacillus ferrooxidans]
MLQSMYRSQCILMGSVCWTGGQSATCRTTSSATSNLGLVIALLRRILPLPDDAIQQAVTSVSTSLAAFCTLGTYPTAAKEPLMAYYRKRRRYRGSSGSPLLNIATMTDPAWIGSAILAGIILFSSWLILPAVFQINPILKILTPLFEMIGSILALIFGFMAFMLFLARDTVPVTPSTTYKPAYQPPKPSQKLQNDNPSPYANPDHEQPIGWSLSLLRDLEWKRFEDLCNEYHRECGLRSTTTGLGADGGVDIRLFHRETGALIAVTQCKAWPDKPIGVELVRQLLGTMTHEKVPTGTFITNGTFTKPAEELAKEDRIILVDGMNFITLIERLPASSQARLLAFATEGDYTTPSCPHCGIKMVPRTNRTTGKKFWGCKNYTKYPPCKKILQMRKGTD